MFAPGTIYAAIFTGLKVGGHLKPSVVRNITFMFSVRECSIYLITLLKA